MLELTKHILGPTVLDESYLVHSVDANVTRPGTGGNSSISRPATAWII